MKQPRPPATSAEKRNRVLLVDGRLCEYVQRVTWSHIVKDAIRTSQRRPDAAVAICKLGDASSLRRFEAGREVGETSKPERAYLLRYRDGDMEPCAVVWAATARLARRQYRAIDGAEYMLVDAERRPAFDDGIPSAAALMERHGWWFRCHVCGDDVRFVKGEPAPVVIDDRAHESKVAHARCHTGEEVVS